jgi:hypothetical protein
MFFQLLEIWLLSFFACVALLGSSLDLLSCFHHAVSLSTAR